MNAHAFEFSQAFNYTEMARFGRGVFVEVTLVANSLMTPTLRVRVDSAASFCVFGRQWADMLALDWETGDPVTIGTATGTFSAYHHNVTIHLLDYEWTAGIAFAEWDMTPPSRARDVLGLTGFFDHFLVTIDDLSEMTYPPAPYAQRLLSGARPAVRQPRSPAKRRRRGAEKGRLECLYVVE